MQHKTQKTMPPNELIKAVIEDQTIRQVLTQKSHFWFFHIYFAHYLKYETALFQKEMLAISEDESRKIIAIVAFRDSGKSTIMNLSYTLWAILGRQQKKHVLIVSQTKNQAKTHFLNIRTELEQNKLLQQDFGPFKTRKGLWGSLSLELPLQGTRISVVSREKSIRGIRHGRYRPDLIICDDLEDTARKTSHGPEKLYQWFTDEVMPSGDEHTRIVILGNLMGDRTLVMRLQEQIAKGRLNGISRRYPLLDDNGRVLWPSRFPTKESIYKIRNTMPDTKTWKREYLLFYTILDIRRLINDKRFHRFIEEKQRKWERGIKPLIDPEFNPRSMKDYELSASRFFV